MLLFNCQRPVLLFLLLLLLITGGPSSVFALQFNANWNYRQSGGEDSETQRQFFQRYSLGIGQVLTYRPTHAITASGAVSYTQTQRDSGSGFTDTHDVTPTARLSLVNDIFLTQISGSSGFTKRGNEEGWDKRGLWDSSVGSTWNIPLWPRLNYSYGEVIESRDEKETNSNFTVNWDLILASLYYRYGTNVSEIDDIEAESVNQSVRLETSARFWNNRLAYTFSQQYNESTQNVMGTGENFIDFPLEGTGFAKVDDPATNPPDPPDEDYVDPDALPQSVAPGERVHISFSKVSNSPEPINILRLSVENTLNVSAALELQWELYTRANSNNPWAAAGVVISGAPVFDDDNSIDLNIPSNYATASEILVVAENTSSQSLNFTQVVAFTIFTEDSSSKVTGYLTNFGMRINLARDLTFNTSLNLDHTELEFDDEPEQKTTGRTVNGNLRWSRSPDSSDTLMRADLRISYLIPVPGTPSLNINGIWERGTLNDDSRLEVRSRLDYRFGQATISLEHRFETRDTSGSAGLTNSIHLKFARPFRISF